MRNPERLLRNSQRLRREMTEEECKLWYQFLKTQSFTVNRQKIIGHYILDFYIAKAKICIELDGSQHYEESHEKRDIERDKYLKEKGIKVLRYSNLEIHRNFKGVCEDILLHCNERTPSTTAIAVPLPPKGEC